MRRNLEAQVWQFRKRVKDEASHVCLIFTKVCFLWWNHASIKNMDFHWVMNTLFNVNKVHVADTEHLILTFEGQIRQHCTCCDLLLPNQDVFQGESSRGELVLLPDMPLPLPRDQAEGLVAVGLAQAWDGDQPPGVSHLLHKVLGGCGKHFECHTHTHTAGPICCSSLSTSPRPRWGSYFASVLSDLWGVQ